MARCVAYEAHSTDSDGPIELGYDTDDVAEISVATGVLLDGHMVPEADREAVITIRFKPGSSPLWKKKE